MTTPVNVAAAQRASMLRMGKSWQELGKINQAVDAYLRLVREHSGSSESEEAKLFVLQLVEGYQTEGRYHLAIDLLDRLAEAAA